MHWPVSEIYERNKSDAEFHRFNANLNCPVTELVSLVPGLQITTSAAEGDANDFASGVFKLQALAFTESQFFSVAWSIGRQEADAEKPRLQCSPK